MKIRDTIILPVRIKKTLYAQLVDALKTSKQPNRNAWMIHTIKEGMRKHKAGGKRCS